jgi:hypothetical protein
MTLSGLWHGASWNFVLWGAYHAALLTGYRIVTPKIPASWKRQWWSGPVAVGIMFCFTVLGWLIFRETHGDRLLAALTKNPFAADPDAWIATWVLLGVCAATSVPLLVALWVEKRVWPRIEQASWSLTVQALAWGGMAIAVLTFARDTAEDFIYFQF